VLREPYGIPCGGKTVSSSVWSWSVVVTKRRIDQFELTTLLSSTTTEKAGLEKIDDEDDDEEDTEYHQHDMDKEEEEEEEGGVAGFINGIFS